MQQIATITSKLQVTVPVKIAKEVGLESGQKVKVSTSKGSILLTPIETSIEELSGSIKLPEKFKNKQIDEIIDLAKQEYFSQKK